MKPAPVLTRYGQQALIKIRILVTRYESLMNKSTFSYSWCPETTRPESVALFSVTYLLLVLLPSPIVKAGSSHRIPRY